MPTPPVLPPCREGATPEDLAREADRAVLYGACLKAVRPDARLKPHLADAVDALLPGVRALLAGEENSSAQFVRDYAAACGGTAFLAGKVAEYRARRSAEPD
jgi:hypothetical protein